MPSLIDDPKIEQDRDKLIIRANNNAYAAGAWFIIAFPASFGILFAALGKDEILSPEARVWLGAIFVMGLLAFGVVKAPFRTHKTLFDLRSRWAAHQTSAWGFARKVERFSFGDVIEAGIKDRVKDPGEDNPTAIYEVYFNYDPFFDRLILRSRAWRIFLPRVRRYAAADDAETCRPYIAIKGRSERIELTPSHIRVVAGNRLVEAICAATGLPAPRRAGG